MVWSSKEKGRGEAGRAKEGGQSQAHSRVWSKVSPSAQASKATIACIPRHCSAAFLPGITWVWAEFWHGNGEFCWLEGTYSATRSSWLFRAVAEGANCQSLYEKLALGVFFIVIYLSSLLFYNRMSCTYDSVQWPIQLKKHQHKVILIEIFIPDALYISIKADLFGLVHISPLVSHKTEPFFYFCLEYMFFLYIKFFGRLLIHSFEYWTFAVIMWSENLNDQTSHIYRCLRNTKLLFKRK